MSDWQSDLDAFLGTKEQRQQKHDSKLEANKALAVLFIEGKVLPAFEEVKAALESHGRNVRVEADIESYVSFTVFHQNELELSYLMTVDFRTSRDFPVSISVVRSHRHPGEYVESVFRKTDVSKLTQDDIRQSLLETYKLSRDGMFRRV